MANRTTQNIYNINVEGNGHGGSSTRRCGACRGTGYADGPVQMMQCHVCHGRGVVRV